MAKIEKKLPRSENHFVLVSSPLEMRRQILESSRKTIYCLQGYQRILLLRHAKNKEMDQVRESLKELKFLSKKLREKIPLYDDLPDVIEHKSKLSAKKTVQTKVVKESPQEVSELDKLEASLNAIENKLNNLR